MTPKEKSEELIKKYMPIVGCSNKVQDSFEYDRAKKCALICVDEILGNKSIIKTQWDINFWQQVKEEIEKL